MDWRDEVGAHQRHQQLLRMSKQQHILAQAYENGRQARPFYGPVLARLGRWMIAWGWRLRIRYGVIEPQAVRDEARWQKV